MNKFLIVLSLAVFSSTAFSFDIEDYAGTYRSERDAYLMRSNNFVLAYNQLINAQRILEGSCYKITGAKFTHLEGIKSGTCAKDNQKPDTYGGVYGGGTKLGTRLKDLLLSTPAWANYPDIVTKVSDAEAENTLLIAADTGSLGVSIALDASCTPTTNYLSGATAPQISDFIDQYKTYYDAYLSAAYSLKSAIAPFKASIEAYKAVSAVYTMSIGCDSQLGIRDPDLYDPYVP